jgi:hypothetical protein
MKSCPTCNRTFEDTFTFCLIDGSVLSAPFDETGKAVPPDRDSSPPRTEVLTGASELASLPQTQAAPPQNFQPTITAPPPPTPRVPAGEPAGPLAAKRSVLPKVLIAVAVLAAVAVLGAVVLWVVLKSGDRNNAVTSASPTATELRIQISYNGSHDDCALRKEFFISWSVDGGRSDFKRFQGPGDEFQVTAKQSFSLSYDGDLPHKCMELTINGRRAKTPTHGGYVLFTTDNYQQFLE